MLDVLRSLTRIPHAPVILMLLAGILLSANEVVHRRSLALLENGIALSDSRFSAMRVLQLMSDAEEGVREFFLDGHEFHLAGLRQAERDLPTASRGAHSLLARIDPGDPGLVTALNGRLSARLEDLSRVEWLARQGRREEAWATLVSSDTHRQRDALRGAIQGVLGKVAVMQGQMRESLRQDIDFNRWVVNAFILLSALGIHRLLRGAQMAATRQHSEKICLEAEVARRTRDLRALASYLIHTREDERYRMARELHDELGGLLSALRLDVARCLRIQLLPAQARQLGESISASLAEGIALKRRIIENLRPSTLEHLGLMESLTQLCRETARLLEIPVQENLVSVKLDREVELTLYRVTQEALNNVRLHAQAREVRVSLERVENRVVLEVRDDGRGFALDQVPLGHHGLAGMRLRVESHGGELLVQSAPGQGCRITARIPAS
ncbi:MAG: ATP-binding protein [Pseudomonadota bacterium]